MNASTSYSQYYKKHNFRVSKSVSKLKKKCIQKTPRHQVDTPLAKPLLPFKITSDYGIWFDALEWIAFCQCLNVVLTVSSHNFAVIKAFLKFGSHCNCMIGIGMSQSIGLLLVKIRPVHAESNIWTIGLFLPNNTQNMKIFLYWLLFAIWLRVQDWMRDKATISQYYLIIIGHFQVIWSKY